jgi:hypothetical protein
MSSPSNLTTVNLGNNSNTSAQQFFNNYFNGTLSITSNQNDAVIAYFQSITKNPQSAQILASTVIYTAISQNINPMTIVQQFQAVAPGQLTLYLAMFLNLNRVGTSLVGINNQPITNKYITRAILA